MPIYTYTCPNCSHKEEKFVLFSEKDQQTCSKCEKSTEFTPSFKFNATGLPNGFSETRSKSRKDS